MIEIIGEPGRPATKEEIKEYMKRDAAADNRCHGCFGASFGDCQKCGKRKI